MILHIFLPENSMKIKNYVNEHVLTKKEVLECVNCHRLEFKVKNRN